MFILPGNILSFVIGTLTILLIGFLVSLITMIKKAKKKPEEVDEETTEAQANRFDSFLKLRNSFIHATNALKKAVPRRHFPYKTPWYLIIGESGVGKSTLLKNTGMNLPLGELKKSETDTKIGVQWWFYDKGVVIEPNGEFILKEDGKSSNENALQNVLKLLKKYRPNRPIDGVILALPTEDMLPGKQKGGQLSEAIREKAEIMYGKIWGIQRTLGVHFPVYVTLTKVDTIPGFDKICQQLPPQRMEEMVGWSNPNSLDTVYSNNWVDEAMEEITSQFFHTQMEILAEKGNVSGSEKIFLFSSGLETIHQNLKTVMSMLFKESAYHASFFLRGIYLTGNSVEKDKGDVKPVFLKHLFEKKVFPESGLARMVDHSMVSKHRRIRLVQVTFAVTLIVGVLGLGNAWIELTKEKEKMLPVLNLISGTLGELENKQTINHKVFGEKALTLLNGMGRVQPSELHSWFVPASWISSVQTEIVNSMTVAYEKIIMKIIFLELKKRAKEVGFRTVYTEKKNKDTENISRSVESMHEFKQFFRFVADLEALEKHIGIYNNRLITGRADSRDFAQMIRYLYNVKLKAEFSKKALEKLQGPNIDTAIIKANANAKIWELSRYFFDEVFGNNYLNRNVEQLKEQFIGFRSKQNAEKYYNIKQLQHIYLTLQTIEELLTKEEFGWIESQELELGNKYDQVMKVVQNSSFLGQSVYSELQKRAEAEFEALKKTMASHTTPLTGPLLEREEDRLRLKFSKQMVETKSALEEYFKQKFAQIDPLQYQIRATIPKGTRLVWNATELREAIKLYDPYSLFLSEKLKNVPRNLQAIFEMVAKESLEANIVKHIALAQTMEPVRISTNPAQRKETLRGEILNFKESAPSLGELLEIFDKLELTKTNEALFQAVATQGNSMIRRTDGILKKGQFYQMRNGNFSWWDGKNPPALLAYNVNDTEEMNYYLKQQLDEVKFLNEEFAKPVVDFLGYKNKLRGHVEKKLIDKWYRINLSLESYQSKKPGNTPSILERFILTDIDTIVSNGCLDRLTPAVIRVQSRDYFLKQRNFIRKMLYIRCQELAEIQQVREF